jgi:hypothetical protein
VGFSGFLPEGGYFDAIDATWYYIFEDIEVVFDVYGHSVVGDGFRDSYADGGNFFVVEPEAGESFASFWIQPKMLEQFNSDLFEFSYIFCDSEASFFDVYDWIEDKLAGIVSGYTATSFYADEVDAFFFEFGGVCKQFVVGFSGSESDDRVVLENQDGIGDLVFQSFFVELELEAEDVAVAGDFVVANP